jgi:hypothetical protein
MRSYSAWGSAVALRGERISALARLVSANIGRQLAACAVLASLGGCSFSYVDSKDVRHVIGFVDVSLPSQSASNGAPEPSIVSVTSVGIHAYSGAPNGGGVVLGYGRETALLIPNNACVDLAAPGACAAAARSLSKNTDIGMRQP